MAETLDLNKLAISLDINKCDNNQRKEREECFLKYKSLPKVGPLLLTISCSNDNNFSEDVILSAAIQLKNYINSYWRFGPNPEYNKSLCFNNDEKIIVISDEDKNFIRNKILEAVIFIVDKENVKVLKQFNQCVKKILKFDYKTRWKDAFVDCLIKCFNSNNQKIIYAGIMLFYQLSKLYQYEDENNLKVYNEVLIKINDRILFFMNECKNINNNVEAMVMYKLIKIFFKSFQGNMPELLQTEDIFNKYSECIVHIIKTPLNQQYVDDRNNIYWKLKRICFQTLTRIIQKYTNLSNRKKNDFQKILHNKYIKIYLEIFTVIYKNHNNNKCYADDYCKAMIYNFYCYILDKKQFKEVIIKLFMENDDLLEEIIKDCYMPKEDLEMWVTDPKNYIAQKSEEINFLNNKRYRAYKLVNALLNCKDKKTKNYICYNKIFEYICNSMINDSTNLEQEENIIKTKYLKDPKDESYIMNPNNIPHCLKKESIIYLIKQNADIIIKNSDIETLIQKYIVPELSSPCGLLREQSCHLISCFNVHVYKDSELLKFIIKKLCELMAQDHQLPVKLYASLAIGSLFDKDVTKTMLKGNIKTVFEIYLKLMKETDTEEIMYYLQEIVKCFTDESQQYIVQLSDYLINYFNSIISRENEEGEVMDTFNLISNIVSTFCNFIQYFINNQNIYPNLINNIDTLLQHCLNNAYDKLEEGLNIIESILKYGNTIPEHLWKFFIPLIESVTGSEEDLIEFKKEFPDQIYNGNGSESLLDISKIISAFIAKDPNKFINMNDKKGVKYFDHVIKLIESIIALSESKSEYNEIKYSLKLINTLFDCYKGKVDNFLEQIIKYILLKYKCTTMDKNLEYYLLDLLSICFIYDPFKTLKFFQNQKCTQDIFSFWFKDFNKLKRMEDLKYNLIGICSLISIEHNQQDKLIIENMKQILENIYLMTEKINKEKIEAEKEEKEENDNNNKDDDDYEELGEDEDNIEVGKDMHMDDMIKKIMDGDIEDGDDDLDYEEEDDDDQPLTNFDKQSPILYVKNTLNNLSQKSPEINKMIIEALNDKINLLNEIFNIEEQRLANNNK